MGLTYGVDLDSGPDRQIHGLVHGVCPLPNLRPTEIGLFILCMVPDAAGRMAPPSVACWTEGNSCGEGGRRDRHRSRDPSFTSLDAFLARRWRRTELTRRSLNVLRL